MTRWVIPLLTLLVVSPGASGEDKPKPDPDKVAEFVVKSLNDRSATDLHQLGNAQFQAAFSLPRLKRLVPELAHCTGKITRCTREKGSESSNEDWLTYRLQAEHLSCYLKVKIDNEGRLTALTLAPVLTDAPVLKKTVDALIQAYNTDTAEAFRQVLSDPLQEKWSAKKLQAFLQEQRAKYGKITGWSEKRSRGNQRSLAVQADKKNFVLKVLVHPDGRLGEFQFGEPWLEEVPAGPIRLTELQQRVRGAVEQARAEARIPSLSLALVKEDRIVWAEAFGYSNVARKVQADPETVYVTGSIIKVIVASAVLQLVDDGKLKLDEPVNHYLKRFQIPNPFEKETPLTMRHLLSHRGGIPYGYEDFPLWSQEHPLPLEDLLRQRVKVETRPGEKETYSNLGYALSGYVVGLRSETPFEDAMQRRLFRPLDMTRTDYEPKPHVMENLAIPYRLKPGGGAVEPISYVRLDVYPAGEAYSTPSDVARFLLMYLNDGQYRGKQILSRKSIEEMASVQFAKKGETTGTGLGWEIASLKRRRVLQHDGSFPGFVSLMVVDPQKRLGLVLMANKRSDGYEHFAGLDTDSLPDGMALPTWILEMLDKLEDGTNQKP